MTKRVIGPGGTIVEVEASDPRPAVLGEIGQQASDAEIFPFHLLELQALAVAAGPKTYRFSVADETPYPRFDWITGEPYMMQLRMTPAAAHLDRTKGGSIRDGHYGDQVGSTLGAEVSNGRLYVSGVRFLSGARAQEIEQGIQPLKSIRGKSEGFLCGYVMANCIGIRISGSPNCALTEPSQKATIE